MEFRFTREQLLNPLSQIIGAVEKRQTMPVLSNALLQSVGGFLQITTSDLEIELVCLTDIATKNEASITVPARKLLDICKNLPEQAESSFTLKNDRVTISSGRSRFVLSTLPAEDFPALSEMEIDSTFVVQEQQFKTLIEQTSFAMAQQDVRYYLNGLLLELDSTLLRTVATDGHRLALSEVARSDGDNAEAQVIIPRKAVTELQRLLSSTEGTAEVSFSSNHIRVKVGNIRFTSKLVDGKFPDYNRVMPQDGDKILQVDRTQLSQALVRTSILSNEKYRGVRLLINPNLLKIQTQNPDKEEAEEEVEIDYPGEAIEIAFNVNYLLDVLNVIKTDQAHIVLKDSNSSCIVHDGEKQESRYVIMPMRL